MTMKICNYCFEEMEWNVRFWFCPNCGHMERDLDIEHDLMR